MGKQLKEEVDLVADLSATDIVQGKKAIAPTCPNCGSPMTRRNRGRSSRAIRQHYWRCLSYPECLGKLTTHSDCKTGKSLIER